MLVTHRVWSFLETMQEIREESYFQMWALKHREVKQLFTQPVSSRGRIGAQASWFIGRADKTLTAVVPSLSLLWFVTHTQPVLQASWAGSQHELQSK